MTDDHNPAPRFSLLSDLGRKKSSEDRRALLRRVTQALSRPAGASAADGLAEVDGLLAAAAADYSRHVRAEIAQLVAGRSAGFARAAAVFAVDDIAVAAPVLREADCLPESVLLKVAAEKSQDHLMAVSQRKSVSAAVSHALAARGDDAVVVSLLRNDGAEIAHATYAAIARRAEESAVLHGPLVRRKDAPIELLNGLYLKVETQLRREILAKFEGIAPSELEAAFRRSRGQVSQSVRVALEDFDAACHRIDLLERRGALRPEVLAVLLREGAAARTAFKIAFARLTGIDVELAARVVEARDIDTMALLCRGAGFARALFVALALCLSEGEGALGQATQLGAMYEAVPMEAARRALRFWKVRAAA